MRSRESILLKFAKLGFNLSISITYLNTYYKLSQSLTISVGRVNFCLYAFFVLKSSKLFRPSSNSNLDTANLINN